MAIPSGLEAVLDYNNFLKSPQLDTHAQAALIPPNPLLSHALSNSTAKGLPAISVLPMAGQYLSVLTQALGAKSVLEIGTLGGYSSICFAQAGAKVTSIEISAKHRDVALKNVQGLDVEVLLGAALDVMPRLAKEGRRFDLVFIDADFDDQLEHFDWAVRLTRPGGCVFFDDVVAAMFKHGYTGKEETVISRIGRDERVRAALVQTPASHPMFPTPVLNGFILALVKDEKDRAGGA